MASDGSATVVSSIQEDEYDDTDDGYDRNYHQNQHNNLSRLSVCTSSMYTNDDDDDDDDVLNPSDMGMYMSRLSLESFDGADADGEVSDAEKGEKSGGRDRLLELISSDSDKEPGCYSLPATPHRRKRRVPSGSVVNKSNSGGKDYASENEAQKGNKGNLRRQRRVAREKSSWVGNKRGNCNGVNSVSGESDHSGGVGGLVVITKPKGGNRSLCMGLEEVKACRDLGFELEHERMLEVVPARVSLSPGSTLETSSGGNSPIANWRISSPGDDPRDVKARLKVWAQAVALASASRHGS